MRKEERTAGGIVFNNTFDKVYLIYKKDRDEWLLPKGHVEEGESIIEAAIRETKEETGLSDIIAIGLSPCATTVFELDNGNTKVISFFVMVAHDQETHDTKFKKEEGLSGQWFLIEEAIGKAKYDDMRQAIKNAYGKTESLKRAI